MEILACNIIWLPVRTDITVNGRKMQASGLTYDDLGRVVSDARGALTGAVSTSYSLHGAVTSVSTKDFSQKLYYNDGPGTPCWNGNVSSTVYSSPTNTRLYGYRFYYNSLGWLSEAAYGEHEALSDNTDRYTERILDCTANGAMKRFQRHGLKQNNIYGKIDNLHITLDGNRVSSVTDDALPVTREGAGDFNADGGAFTYDACGNMTSDSSRGIASIEYDNLNHPIRAQFSDGSLTEWAYSADGTKLRTVHTTAADGVTVAMGSTVELTPDMVLHRDTTDYRGPLVIENGQLSRVLFAGGYAGIRESDRVPVYHYYTLDHVGNVRAVTREDGAVVQQTDYYPFGGVIADRGFGRAVQPNKTVGLSKALDKPYYQEKNIIQCPME